MKIIVVGGGQVGSTIVEALHGEHTLTVIDVEAALLESLAHGYDVSRCTGTAPAAPCFRKPESRTPTS